MSSVIKKGAADQSRYIVLTDSADGTPETGYAITGLDLQYTRQGSTPVTKADATALAATDSAHADNKAIEIDATSSPGLYRVDWPDAAFASGADKVLLVVSGTGLYPAVEEIQLVDYDPQDGVRLGLTALPNAAADAAGGLPISDAGGLDLDTQLANTNEITAARAGYMDNLNGHTAQSGDSYALANGGSGFVATKADTAAILLDTGTDGVVLTAAERNAVADAVLSRDVSSVEGAAADHSLCYVVLAMSESNTTANAGKLTVFRTDGVTEFAQKPITTDAAAEPITGVQ